MSKKTLPLKEVSIAGIFDGNDNFIYEIPIYQRNYAWEKDEITTLVQDIYDSLRKNPDKVYYIGTLVSFHKGDNVFEIIDGQQRLTTIRLLLGALEQNNLKSKLTYRARKKSDETLKAIPAFNIDEKDGGIENGYKYARTAIDEIVPKDERAVFCEYFKNKVHIIHYQVPKDIDLNHYFEIMNSRGEQLEKQEIVKAKLMQKLDSDEERTVFNAIWECCSEMNVYVQQNMTKLDKEAVFGKTLIEFIPNNFEDIQIQYKRGHDKETESLSIENIIDLNVGNWVKLEAEIEKKDSFQQIIDFPNFLLIVLKFTRMTEPGFDPIKFQLDDKELLNEFDEARFNAETVRLFAFNLLKCRFFLDNYIVHHSKEEDNFDSNPWKLQVWHRDVASKKTMLANLCENNEENGFLQDRLAHLLSMFEVSFTARQRKNYLFYCLLYLMGKKEIDLFKYAEFVEKLANRYFAMVYLDKNMLNAINTPIPGSFDEVILKENRLNWDYFPQPTKFAFDNIYGTGEIKSNGVPLFIFNYLDYKLWKLYSVKLRGNEYKEDHYIRREFFAQLGCSDFGQKIFDQFYFSRTRRSLEHYYPQANATGKDGALNENQINCLGNYAMIGSEANSAGSNWTPLTKLDHYLDQSKKISQISVASIKFMIMMQMCKDSQKWDFQSIVEHQNKMVEIILNTK